MSAPAESPPAGENPVLILTGPPGTGKSTTAEILAERRDRSVHLEADAFFRFLRGGYVEPWRPESRAQNETVMRIVATAAAGYASAGYFTIVDGIVIPGWFFEPLRDALQDSGHAVALAVLRAPVEDCIARVEAREGGSTVEPAAIEQLWRSFADLGELEENVLDVDGLGPEELADLLERRLHKLALR